MEQDNNSHSNKNILSVCIIAAGAIVAGALLYNMPAPAAKIAAVQSDGIVLPVVWGDLGIRLIEAGVIDADRFSALYSSRGQFTDEYRQLLFDKDNGRLKITKENADYLLNLLWALGLGNKSPILEEGEMMDPKYGGPQNFASTGGWTMARGHAMDHYSMHNLVELTLEQEGMVDRVSRNIFRPCCSNSAHFPDCNHGMAMLGLLELLASQGVSEDEMYRNAILVNSYWFPGYYDSTPSSVGCSV